MRQGEIGIRIMRKYKKGETSLKSHLKSEKLYAHKTIKIHHNARDIVGKSAPFKKTFQMVERVAATDATVLILGETGTGKELCARSVHNLSARKHGPFIKVDCGAIPAELI